MQKSGRSQLLSGFPTSPPAQEHHDKIDETGGLWCMSRPHKAPTRTPAIVCQRIRGTYVYSPNRHPVPELKVGRMALGSVRGGAAPPVCERQGRSQLGSARHPLSRTVVVGWRRRGRRGDRIQGPYKLRLVCRGGESCVFLDFFDIQMS